MAPLTLARSREILAANCDDAHLLLHALAVSSAMAALAERFNGDVEHWRAVGYLHDVDYQHHPDEHLAHTRPILEQANVDEEDIRAILAHGWGICSEVKPETDLEKCLFAVDELTGIVMAAALMRPTGIVDMEVKSAAKKFKDKRFAAKCDREVINSGCELLGISLNELLECTIAGMKREAEALGLTGTES